MNLDLAATVVDEPTLEQKVRFLSQPDAYPDGAREITRIETHMSWVFLVGDRAYKLKKPVRFPYLDFSTATRREAACRAEIDLNRRLARDVYLKVAPVSLGRYGLSIGGEGAAVDWLVVMRRLDQAQMLDRIIAEHRYDAHLLDRVIDALACFYRRARRVFVSPAAHLIAWRANLAYNHRVLLSPRLRLPSGLVRDVDRVQRRFLANRTQFFIDRVRQRRIVDAHGDLRPEHIWIGDSLKIIDCLEFNASLRILDPFDEVAYLSLECERLGAKWAGDYIRRRIKVRLRDGPSDQLFIFYRCYRATLRARLAAAHLLEPHPRTPEKWLPLALTYLKLAAADARRLDRFLRAPADPRALAPRAGG